jgi:hypothetical protein
MIPLSGPEVVQLVANAVFHNLGQPIQEGAFAGLIEGLDILQACQERILNHIPRLQLSAKLGAEPGADCGQNPHHVPAVKLI